MLRNDCAGRVRRASDGLKTWNVAQLQAAREANDLEIMK